MTQRHIVFYRKYRPKFFRDFIGQEAVVKTITNAILENKVAHGYLFAGAYGCGKTTLARLLAKAINCLNRKENEFEPCNQCVSCLEINQGNAIDLIEIDAASNRGIDEIRDLKAGIRFQPVKSKYKIFIIDEAHQLTKEAVNALLKTLEEPPAHAIFILVTTELHKMIPTILSRCQQFIFRKLKMEDIIRRLEYILQEEGIRYEKEALQLIALKSAGSVRDAETLLGEAVNFVGREKGIDSKIIKEILGLPDRNAIFQCLDFLKEKNCKEFLMLLNDLRFKGVDLYEFASDLLEYLREVLFLKISPNYEGELFLTLSPEEKKKMKELTACFSEKNLRQMAEKFLEALNKMKYSSITQLPLELAAVEICFEMQ